MGVSRDAVDQPADISKMVAHAFCDTLQDANARGAQPTGLPAGCERGVSALHYAATAGRAVGDAVLSRRRPLGAETAEFATLVQDGECMVRSLDEGGRGRREVMRWDSINQAMDRRSRANL